ncbi:hypothetical protein BD410DRAFT_701578, partial [Rickenella mellea]
FLPFKSEVDWRVAKWFIKDGPEMLGLSFHNIRDLHSRIDKLPKRAIWNECTVSLKDDPMQEHLIQYRNPVHAIQSLWGNPAHTEQLVYRPEKMWSNSSKDSQLYNEMWTGDWWWKMQDLLPEGATISPVILSTDKTQLTLF